MPGIIVDPELIAAVTRQFNIRGELQPFNLTENVVPVFDIGRLTGITQIQKVTTPDEALTVRIGQAAGNDHLAVAAPVCETTDIVTDSKNAPSAGTILSDTGQLAAGIHWISTQISQTNTTVESMIFEWRNAANSAALVTFRIQLNEDQSGSIDFVGNFALNERLRWSPLSNTSGDVSSWIMHPLTDRLVAV